MTELQVNTAAEAGPFAYELAKAYRGMVNYYRQEYKLEPAEAAAKAAAVLALDPDNADHSAYWDRLVTEPPQQLTWLDFNTLADNDPAAASLRWQQTKQLARDELESGMRGADVIGGGPWERAQYLAIRQSLIDAWQPANGIELSLIEAMAQAQALCFRWISSLVAYSEIEDIHRDSRKLKNQDEWEPPRVTSVVAVEHSAAMVDRFNRLFLRTLRQLRDLRRYTPAVMIQSAGQVNIGGQQLNVAMGTPGQEPPILDGQAHEP